MLKGCDTTPTSTPIDPRYRGAIATYTDTNTYKDLSIPGDGSPSAFAPDGARENPDVDDDGFDAFWAGYPARDGRKGSKAEARAAWGRLGKAARARAMIGLGHYAAWMERSGRYPKDAVRFLRPLRGAKTALFEEWQEPALDGNSSPGESARFDDSAWTVPEPPEAGQP